MAKRLQAEGWTVHTGSNGREGLKAYEIHEPDLIILDLMMPEMDGFEFMDQIRCKPAAENVSVVVVTAKDLSAADYDRLNGSVQRIIQKRGRSMENIVDEIKRHLR